MNRPSGPWHAGGFLLCLCAAGCAAPKVVHTSFQTSGSPMVAPSRVYPTHVEYELLSVARGKACVSNHSLQEDLIAGESPIEAGTGHPAVYQAAKYNALESMPEADNLTAIRAFVEQDEEQQCVTVAGRAYRIVALSSEAPSDSPGSVFQFTEIKALPPCEEGDRKGRRRGTCQ